jgi:hypothetical protein
MNIYTVAQHWKGLSLNVDLESQIDKRKMSLLLIFTSKQNASSQFKSGFFFFFWKTCINNMHHILSTYKRGIH